MFVVMILNMAVAIAKLGWGFYADVVALQADGLHSTLDAFANVVGLIGLHFAAAPPDSGHPYGHRRVEHLAAAALGILILFGGFEVGRGAWNALQGVHRPRTGLGGMIVILVTLCINIGVTRWESRKGRELDSPFLCADAKHTLSDVFATCVVLVSYCAASLHVYWADPAAAMLVMGLIAYTGVAVLRENIPVLIDAAVIDVEGVRAVVLAVPGVANCHRIRSRGSRNAVHLDLHIQVNPRMTVRKGHDVSHLVQDTLRASFPGVVEVLVHLEPDVPEERHP
jgi:cation diffusion facilitator family transporter